MEKGGKKKGEATLKYNCEMRVELVLSEVMGDGVRIAIFT